MLEESESEGGGDCEMPKGGDEVDVDEALSTIVKRSAAPLVSVPQSRTQDVDIEELSEDN